MEVFNLFDGALEAVGEREGFRCRGTRLGLRLGAAELGGTVYELPPGERVWPYHFHHANEEWLLVLAGEPALREPEGERRLAAGDVVCFPPGPTGAHQLRNDGDAPARLLVLSTMLVPDVVEYPDSGKVGVRAGETSYNVARRPELDYWEGEG